MLIIEKKKLKETSEDLKAFLAFLLDPKTVKDFGLVLHNFSLTDGGSWPIFINIAFKQTPLTVERNFIVVRDQNTKIKIDYTKSPTIKVDGGVNSDDIVVNLKNEQNYVRFGISTTKTFGELVRTYQDKSEGLKEVATSSVGASNGELLTRAKDLYLKDRSLSVQDVIKKVLAGAGQSHLAQSAKFLTDELGNLIRNHRLVRETKLLGKR